MADARASLYSIDGVNPRTIPGVIDASTITYDSTKARGSASVDLAVTLSASKTFALCADGDMVWGKLQSVEPDGACTVVVGGGITLPGGSGATLTAGTAIVGALGAASAKGYIRSANTATAAEGFRTRFRIWDATDATAVQVYC
jgi:hypothetical protein